jgi:hypothetical protein
MTAKETDFARIKRAAENERTKKLQAEAKLNSLGEEQERILLEVETLTGKPLRTSAEVDLYMSELKSQIEGKITEMKEILEAEGVSY